MTIYDVTMTLEAGMPVWPGDPEVEVKLLSLVAAGDKATVRQLKLTTHTGTHVDAPAHFLADGKTVDQIPLSACLGRATVVNMMDTEVITANDLENSVTPRAGMRLLLRTKAHNSTGQTPKAYMDFVPLSLAAANWLVENEVSLVGVDGPSVEALTGNGDVHRRLLSAGIVIIENLQLEDARPGEFDLICLPLKIADGDGAPARVLLRSH